jgi:hypothetical protein
LATERSEEIIQTMKVKEREIDLWIDMNKLPGCMKKEIMPNVQRMLEQKKEVDVQNLLSHLPSELARKIKRYICLPMLKKVSPLAFPSSPHHLSFIFLFDKLSGLHVKELQGC